MEEQNHSLEGQMVELWESMQRENERLWSENEQLQSAQVQMRKDNLDNESKRISLDNELEFANK